MKKFMLIGLVAAFTLSLTSCEKSKIKNCVDDIAGTYSGTQTCGGDIYTFSFTIAESDNDFDRIIFNFAGDLINATVDDDCGIVMDNTNLIDSYGNAFTVNGTADYDDGSLDGTLVYTYAGYGGTCTFDTSRQ